MNGFVQRKQPAMHPLAMLLPVLLSAALLAGCSATMGGATMGGAATPLPTLVLDQSQGQAQAAGPSATAAPADKKNTATQSPAQSAATLGGGATASGKVVSIDQANIASAQGGKIQALKVAEGDTVQAGQVLATFTGSEALTAAVTAAQVQLLTAQQAVTDLKNNADLLRSQAQLRLANAKDALDQAQKHRGYKEYRVGSDTQIAVARADLIVAEDRLKKTQDIYAGAASNPNDNLNKAEALSALSAAQIARDKAQANLNYLLSLPDPLQVGIADADLAVAQSELAAAQVEYDRLKNGPDPDKLALAEAQVNNAQAQLTASQAALDSAQIKAPFGGVVSGLSLHAGEWVAPGQALLTLVDTDHLRVETIDLSERDVPKIQAGQAATVLIKPLNQSVKARVRSIAPTSDTLGGDVVYQTTLDLDSLPAGIRVGMSAEVQFGE